MERHPLWVTRRDGNQKRKSSMNRLVAIGVATFVGPVVAGVGLVAPGQPAPSLSDVRWIQGDPVSSFETGRVYVIEFWSTWCGACVESIEHLNELAGRYRADSTFVAIHIWQHESSPKPTDFLENRAKAAKPIMKFPVAEDVDGSTAKAWMDATANAGLPIVMILDRTSRLVWFGHAADLEDPLNEVIDGTLDIARRSAEMNRRIQVGKLAKESDRAINDKNYDEGIKLILEALDADPKTVAPWIPSTYGHLLATSRSKEIAAGFANTVLSTDDGKKTDLLAGLANAIFHFRPKELRDLDLALALATQAGAVDTNRDPQILALVAEIRAELGNPSNDR